MTEVLRLASVSALRKRFTFWLFMLTGKAVLGFDPEKDGMEGLKKLVRERFPEVRHLRVAELDAWLADPNRPQPQIIDVRNPDEFSLSHLPGARRVDPDGDAPALHSLVAANRPVVLYCAMGFRSSNFARRLMKAGMRDVFSLEGAIFQWANEGRRLVDENGPVAKVHPYSDRWAVLLKPGVRGVVV
ncbi:MAG: rhodanese-like domain-containing protein [Vicinamibacteria bacterium]